jgi:hypothetical protein
MESIHPSTSSGEAQPAARRSSCYAQPAPADEVVMKRHEFLLLHARKGRHLACAERRLDRIEKRVARAVALGASRPLR